MPFTCDNETRFICEDIQEERKKFNRNCQRRGKQYIYPEQSFEGSRIVSLFTAVCIVTFVAPMQWGKTGVILEAAYSMVKPTWNEDEEELTCAINPMNVFVITGMSDNEWRKQTKARFPEQWRDNVVHRGNLKKIDAKMHDIRDALIVIDECHFGTSHETQVSKKLQEWFGLPDPSQLVERNIKILQTSATPDNVILSATRWTELIGQMHHTHITPTTISPNYTGVHTFFEQDRIFESVDLSDYSALTEIKTKIDQYDTPKYHIFRISPKIQKQIATVNNLEHFAEINNYDVITHDSEDRITDPEMLLKAAPEQHTIILIKGFWRAAKTLPDANIGIVHEYKADDKSDTAEAQGLVGRLCGYGRKSGEQAPKVFCSMDSASRYCYLASTGFDYTRDDVEYFSAGIDKKINKEATVKKGSFLGDTRTNKRLVREKLPLKQMIFNTIGEAKRWVAGNIKPEEGKRRRPQPNLPAANEQGFRCIKHKNYAVNTPLTLEQCREIIDERHFSNGNIKGRLAFPFYEDPETPETLKIVVFYNDYITY